jgi:hypothetical protein
MGKQTFEQLRADFPEILEDATLEEVMHIIQIKKAIEKQDTPAYLAVMNRAYGTKVEPEGQSKEIAPPDKEIIKMISEKLEEQF